jgi:hypothetical protein
MASPSAASSPVGGDARRLSPSPPPPPRGPAVATLLPGGGPTPSSPLPASQSPHVSPREPAFVARGGTAAAGGSRSSSPIKGSAAAYALYPLPAAPISPSSGLAAAAAAPLLAIAARDVSKVEKAILPLVPTSEASWLVFVLSAPHAAVFSVCDACLRRLADDVKYEVDALERLRPFRALVGAATRFASSRIVCDKAFKVLRRCATMGRPETADARRDAIVRAGALEACSLAFATHGRECKAVTDNVCGLLQGLAMGDETRKELCCEWPGLLRDLVAAVRQHQGLDSAKSALWNIAVGSDTRRSRVVKAGGGPALASRPAGAEKGD